MGLARITKSDHPRNLGFTSTELQNEQWQRWVTQRALLSLSTEHAAALDEENDGSVGGRQRVSYSTGVRMGAPLFFTKTTRNFAGSVLLALRPTT